jgi:hypothetical protein
MKTVKEIYIMNKKIILLVAVLLIITVVFVACKGKSDVEGTTESTTETTMESENNSESDDGDLILSPDISDVEILDENFGSGEGFYIDGGSGELQGEDSIDWNELG